MATLSPGFADPVLAAQATFRGVMDAVARPCTVVPLIDTPAAPPPLCAAAAAIALTLFDHDAPVWLDPPLAQVSDVAAWIRFHTGAPIVTEPAVAAFALVSDPAGLRPFRDFAAGTLENPDTSATLILQVTTLEDGPALDFIGPGVAGRATLRAAPLPNGFAEQIIANRALFPRGVDLLFATRGSVAALPRSATLVGEV
ncbi:phosphonate C-P lyase system protein PhnH [Rhodoplanes roseus]|uniref:Phosphonate C-P lyase system protein PhnH n=1 Tax=Rhodoplanes roseus TaxID=29409 RepID=A0A327L336_9BRAD|nr:phosphonate C-P lyase system protein PhnH [Rhodoplanes roseus]RAI44911.1 phosphonate C-P lyase system protein PhnH [Rhodoplanes roseus]